MDAKSEIWTYVGRRWDATEKKMYHSYLDESGKELLYAKALTYMVVGGAYTLPVTRDEKGRASVRPMSGTYLGMAKGAGDKVREWQALDQQANVARDMHRLQKKDASSKLPEMTLAELRVVLKRSPTPHRRALLATILDILNA